VLVDQRYAIYKARRGSGRMPAIRIEVRQDIPRIIQFYRQLVITSSDTEQQLAHAEINYQDIFDRISAIPGHELLVVEDEGEVIGTMVLIIVPNLSHQASPWALAGNLVVDCSDRRKGLAKLLMKYAVYKARNAGCYKITLSSHKSHRGAHTFYHSMGSNHLRRDSAFIYQTACL